MLSNDELAMLMAIRETGSLSRAAAHLGKAPSTISHAARQLEERYDALLFDRRRYRLQLTPAGQLLAEEALRLSEDVSRLAQRVKQVAGGWEDRLHIVTDELIEFENVASVIRAFDTLGSGVRLRVTHEVLGGTWEALREGRADLIIGATNEPPAIPSLRWIELGTLEWVFAISPRHPLAKTKGPLDREMILRHRAIVVADSARRTADIRGYGVQSGQATLAVPSMRAKAHAHCEALGIGWLPKARVSSLIVKGELVVKETVEQREPNTLYAAWRGKQEGRALKWWVEQLKQPKLAKRLVQGIDSGAA